MMTATILPSPAATVQVQAITTFDRAAFNAAVERAKRDCASYLRWSRAVEKATEYLDQDWCKWQLDPRTCELLITSSDRVTRYTVSAGQCSCPADSICWHRAARRLLILAGEISAQRSQPRKPYTDVCAEADELYN
jgi:hypothetical protein